MVSDAPEKARRPDFHKKAKGTLIVIGGHEDKSAENTILQEVCKRARKGNSQITIITAASQVPEEVTKPYLKLFNEQGIRRVEVLDIRERENAYTDESVSKVAHAAVLLFTGGDQLRITSLIGDSPVYRCMQQIYQDGGTIVGTSAGAAAMSETMLIYGEGDASYRVDSLDMAPGLGLLRDAVVDSHFAERGRIGRLVGAVAQNPRNIGIGIDEDTAIVVEKEDAFRVLGTGAIYVLDGTGISYTSLSEKNPQGILSLFNIKMHVLGHGDRYDLINRVPIQPKDGEKDK